MVGFYAFFVAGANHVHFFLPATSPIIQPTFWAGGQVPAASLSRLQPPLAAKTVHGVQPYGAGGMRNALRRGGMPVCFIDSFNRLLSFAPVSTNVVSAALLCALSDWIAQTLEPSSTKFDRERWLWMVAWGATVSGAFVYFWLQFLGRLYPLARTSLSQLVCMVATDMVLETTLLNSGFFAFVIWTRVEPKLRIGRSPERRGWKRSQLMDKYRTDLFETIKRATFFWTCVQTLNFRFCPPRYGALLVNVAFVFWTTYLSIVGNRAGR